ncbi:uncharacterized protein F4822DRAFT_430733 [Hypoxylon trugodes]|uniref:uncharacterized protein n=1 Tax=Hypoxylon trugodes TaxID=326681 RepID=UPI00219464BE|nr:uncharacterized protein F4822DRAFT_430733 [Hypoxylon trugodes]KAI1387983.1 hypothetical protein F4822DRAFT_430733 [Hypoxylon trugodes]
MLPLLHLPPTPPRPPPTSKLLSPPLSRPLGQPRLEKPQVAPVTEHLGWWSCCRRGRGRILLANTTTAFGPFLAAAPDSRAEVIRQSLEMRWLKLWVLMFLAVVLVLAMAVGPVLMIMLSRG